MEGRMLWMRRRKYKHLSNDELWAVTFETLDAAFAAWQRDGAAPHELLRTASAMLEELDRRVDRLASKNSSAITELREILAGELAAGETAGLMTAGCSA
jgi:hypothetical protein